MSANNAMTDEPQTNADQPTGIEALGQPQGAVPMTDLDKAASPTAQSQAAPSIPAKESVEPATDASTSSPAKGKDKAPESPAVSDNNKPKDHPDDSLSIEPTDPPAGSSGNSDPVCTITLLLPTGARHPYRIDEKYLDKRNVEIPGVTESGKKDPFSISIYKLKELILREWREEWENKPASPSSIRLIHFGKLLDDKEQLSSKCFETSL
jgi:hypothetical protein